MCARLQSACCTAKCVCCVSGATRRGKAREVAKSEVGRVGQSLLEFLPTLLEQPLQLLPCHRSSQLRKRLRQIVVVEHERLIGEHALQRAPWQCRETMVDAVVVEV